MDNDDILMRKLNRMVILVYPRELLYAMIRPYATFPCMVEVGIGKVIRQSVRGEFPIIPGYVLDYREPPVVHEAVFNSLDDLASKVVDVDWITSIYTGVKK